MKSLYLIALIVSINFFISCEKSPTNDHNQIVQKVQIISPKNGDTVFEILKIQCEVSDSQRVEQIQLWIDDQNTGITDTFPPYQFLWNTTAYPDSSDHRIFVIAANTDGSQTYSDTITVTVDNTLAKPHQIDIRLIVYDNAAFYIKWTGSPDEDFESYQLYESPYEDMHDQILLFETQNRRDTTFTVSGIQENIRRYYRLVVSDSLGLQSSSDIKVGTSYPLIAYVLNSGGTRIEIYTVDIEGYGKYRLTHDANSDRHIIITMDGQQLVYDASNYIGTNIMIMDLDGSNQLMLGAGSHPQISPMGDIITYQKLGGIWIMNLDGSNKQQLTEKWGYPRFSSDGSKIIFDNNGAVYTMNSDGSNLTQLTDTLQKNFGPVFSPDDLKIAFFSDRNARGELYIMNSDGSEQTRLTGETYSFPWQAPLFFPDGDKILFVKWQSQQSGIYKININGGQEVRLSGGYNPKFSPDGSKIGFISSLGDIYILDLANGQTTRLTNTIWDEEELAFQPRF